MTNFVQCTCITCRIYKTTCTCTLSGIASSSIYQKQLSEWHLVLVFTKAWMLFYLVFDSRKLFIILSLLFVRVVIVSRGMLLSSFWFSCQVVSCHISSALCSLNFPLRLRIDTLDTVICPRTRPGSLTELLTITFLWHIAVVW